MLQELQVGVSSIAQKHLLALGVAALSRAKIKMYMAAWGGKSLRPRFLSDERNVMFIWGQRILLLGVGSVLCM
jgi:hypothetical protein